MTYFNNVPLSKSQSAEGLHLYEHLAYEKLHDRILTQSLAVNPRK
jgi:hypothetical protein